MTITLQVPLRRNVAVGCAAAIVLGAGIVTAATRTDPASRETRLASANGVSLRLPDGSTPQGYAGELLPDGTLVRTADGGSAALVTGSRTATLVGAGSVVVRGVHDYALSGGTLVVASGHGPALSVEAGSVLVGGLAGTVRIDRDYSVRVATYSAAGSAAHVSVPTGAGADVGRLSQLEVAAVALPATGPLHLATPADAADQLADPPLVMLETVLDARAASLDGDTAVAAGLAARGVETTPSEVLLPAAIAIAAGVDEARATALRAEQASWGVIAADLGATAVKTGSALDGLLAIDSSGSTAAAQAAGASAPPTVDVPPTDSAPSSPAPASAVGPVVPSAPVAPSASSASPTPGVGQTTTDAPPSSSASTPARSSGPPARVSSAPASTAPPRSAAATTRPPSRPTTTPAAASSPPASPGAVDGLLQAVASVAPSPIATLLPSAAPTALLGIPLPSGSPRTGSGSGASPSASPTPAGLLNGIVCLLLCPGTHS